LLQFGISHLRQNGSPLEFFTPPPFDRGDD
jgi:hypothetical protein